MGTRAATTSPCACQEGKPAGDSPQCWRRARPPPLRERGACRLATAGLGLGSPVTAPRAAAATRPRRWLCKRGARARPLAGKATRDTRHLPPPCRLRERRQPPEGSAQRRPRKAGPAAEGAGGAGAYARL